MPGNVKNVPGADYKRESGHGEKGGQKPEFFRHSGKKNRRDGKNGQRGNPGGRNTRDSAQKNACNQAKAEVEGGSAQKSEFQPNLLPAELCNCC